jgi:signal transduction histidine kinase
MLDGFDHEWTDAGTRRAAYYTNIPPGKYHFVVRMKIADSEFVTGQQATLAFELLPHFYQTIWFWALAIVVAAALILWYFRQRVRRVEREFSAVMGERNRIAREIHDTLAQGYVGISLQLEVLGQLLRNGRTEIATKHLALTQELVREGLDDARQSIWALRSQDGGEQTLPVKLQRLVEQSESTGLTAALEVHGAYRALTAESEKEILRIAQEAIQNVKKHAAASKLTVRLDYDQRMVALTVRDDGKGFEAGRQGNDPQKVAVQGHYGLTGMRERAAIIHAELEITSEPGQGTTVQLKLPTAAAIRNSMEEADKD